MMVSCVAAIALVMAVGVHAVRQPIWTYAGDGAPISAPSNGPGMYFIGSADGFVRALNVSTGAVVWQTHGGGGEVAASPTYDAASNAVYSYTMSGVLRRLTPDTGAVTWTANVDGALGGTAWPPAVAGGAVMVVSDALLIPFHVGSGQQQMWQLQTSCPPTFSADRSTGWIGFESGYLTAFNTHNGNQQWQAPESPNDLPTYMPTASYVSLFVTSGSQLLAVDKDNGDFQRATELPTASGSPFPATGKSVPLLSADGGTVVVTTNYGLVGASAYANTVTWKHMANLASVDISPVSVDFLTEDGASLSSVCVGQGSGDFLCVDAPNGTAAAAGGPNFAPAPHAVMSSIVPSYSPAEHVVAMRIGAGSVIAYGTGVPSTPPPTTTTIPAPTATSSPSGPPLPSGPGVIQRVCDQANCTGQCNTVVAPLTCEAVGGGSTSSFQRRCATTDSAEITVTTFIGSMSCSVAAPQESTVYLFDRCYNTETGSVTVLSCSGSVGTEEGHH